MTRSAPFAMDTVSGDVGSGGLAPDRPASLCFTPLPTATVRALQAMGPDSYSQTPRRQIADANGMPCRHCLRMVPAGAPYLVLAHRPFPAAQPYAETGPIFLCAAPCEPYSGGAVLPPFLESPTYLLRGYSAEDWIVYGSGRIVETSALIAEAEALLAAPQIAYLHVRSASNNCYQCRIDLA